MLNTPITDNKRLPSFRIARCGNFPHYQLNEVSFQKRNLIYLVSVGKEKFEHKWVERFVNFIKEVKPQKTIVVVADSLQRFNIEVDENLGSDQAFNESIKRGEKWAQKYTQFFSDLEINYEFMHWEALKEDKDFKGYFHEIEKLDKENEAFKEALSISSKEYSSRASRVNSSTDYEKAKTNSCKFLIEECAVFQVLAKDKNNLAIVYPGAVTDILAYAINHINENRSAENTFHWLDLRPTKNNKRKKNIEPKVKEPIKTRLFRSTSLNEAQLPSRQIHQNLNEKPTFFRRPSLNSYFSEERPNKFLRV